MGGADAQPPRARGHRRPALHVRGRAQDRRPGDQPGLSRRRARARRHARQRRGGRGRHAQPAHDRRDPAARRGRARAGGGARRGVHVAEGLHRAQRAPRGSGRVDVHEPPQLRRRHDPPARPRRRGQAAAVDLVLPGGRHRGAVLRAPLAGARVAARARLSRQPRHQAARQRGRGDRAVPGRGSGAAASSTSRSTASSSRSTSSSCSAGWAPSGATRAGRSPGSSRPRPPSRRSRR